MNLNYFNKNSKYSLKKIDILSAYNFWVKSSQSTFFTDPKKINSLEKKVEWWMVSKGQEELCMWTVCYSENKKVHLPLFSYYFGPIWSKSFLNISNHSKLSTYCNIYEIFFNTFKKRYKKFIFQTHYSEHDLRYFIWWNEDNKNKFNIRPKYSSIINDLNKKNEYEIFSNFRELRRRMITKAKKNKEFVVSNTFKLSEIVKLYKQTLKIKNQKTDKEVIKKIKIFYDFCKTDDGKIVGFKDKEGKIVSINLLTFSKDTANLILNLSDHKWKKTGITALNMLESIKFSKKKGIKIFDFNGANSPIGADDKNSYGGENSLFFELELRN